MAMCVALTTDGTLIPTGQPVESCAGYVLVTGSEHSFYALAYQAFAMPEPEVAAGWFVGAFGAVVMFYVVARMAGSVASVFK